MMSKELDDNAEENEGMHLVVKNTFLEFAPRGFNDGRRASAPTRCVTVSTARRGTYGKISVDVESLDTEACSSVLSSAETESVGAWAADHIWSSDDTIPSSKTPLKCPMSGLVDDAADNAGICGLPLTSTRIGDFDSFFTHTDPLSSNAEMDTEYFHQYTAPVCHSRRVNQDGQWPIDIGHQQVAAFQQIQSPSGYSMMQDWRYEEPLPHTFPRESLSPMATSFRQDTRQLESPKRKAWSSPKAVGQRAHNFNDNEYTTASNNEYTTVMLRNLPNDYTRDMLMELLDTQGFSGRFDFIYVPFDFKKHAGLGYAFMNMVTHQDAMRAMKALTGFHNWKLKSNKVMQVAWSTPLQGLWANVERYKNSPVMHPDVPNEFKPLLFANGVSVDFPPPTKALQAPVLNQ